MPGPSDLVADLRVGNAVEMSTALTRSCLPDGRVVGWYGAPGVVIDAEVATLAPPRALAARYGTEAFWERWTAAECGAKALHVPIALWLREHGLSSGPIAVRTVRLDDFVVSVAEVPARR